MAILLVPAVVSGTVLPFTEPETQGISVSTNVIAAGSITQDSELQWRLSSELLDSNLVFKGEDVPEPVIEPEPPLNADGEVQAHIAYSEKTQANLGIIAYRKTSTVETEAAAGAGYNVMNDRLINFEGFDAGRIYSSENLMMHNVGNSIRTSSATICPFAEGTLNCIPMFCNRIEAGSILDMSTVSVSTSAATRNVNIPGSMANWPPIPSADQPARLMYGIRVTGTGQGVPAVGSVSTSLDILKNEGGAFCPNRPVINQQIRFEESRNVLGDITLFDYLVTYESGLVR